MSITILKEGFSTIEIATWKIMNYEKNVHGEEINMDTALHHKLIITLI